MTSASPEYNTTVNNEKTEKSEKKRKKISKKARRIIIFSSIGAVLVALVVSIIISNFCLKITHHSIQSHKIDTSVRVALISDLHSRSFGKDNHRLLKKVSDNAPDIILLTGDIISHDDTDDEDMRYLENTIKSFAEIAPTYFSIGNHERFNSQLQVIKATVNRAGGRLLDSEYTDVYVNGNKLRVGGISYYRFWDEDSNSYLEEFTNVDDNTFTLLLCHNPEFYLWGIKNYPIDLVASGHTHGGMVKIPFAGPLYAPEQGWFPDYAAGLYEFENGHLAVTTGLASSPEYLPRIFNRPEIMIIDLK